MNPIRDFCCWAGFASYSEFAAFVAKMIGATALCYVAFVGLLVVL